MLEQEKEQNNPAVSVIVSTYNRKKLLKKTVNSVLGQSFPDFELIIVDDCSTDSTEKYVKGLLKDKRIRYFKTKYNTGHDGQPKNLGVKNAKGTYVSFLDDDDVWRPDTLKILYRYAKHSGADITYGDYLIRGKPGWSVDFSVPLLQKMNFITPCDALIKRNCIMNVGGFDENIPRHKDWNLFIRLQKRGYTFMHVPIIVLEVSVLPKSISATYEVKYDEMGNYLPTYFDPVDCKIYSPKTILGKERPLRVAVFTLIKDRFEYTMIMSNFMRVLSGYPFDWFVIDQKSGEDMMRWYLSAPIKRILYNQENTGIAKGWNQAIKLIKETDKYDIIIKIDNDAQMLTKGWLKSMVSIFERNRKVILSPYVEGLEDSPGGVLRQRASGEMPYVLINDNVLGIVPYLGGIVWAAPIELYEDFSFDESGFMVGNKDYLISLYAKSQGYGLFYIENLRVYHIDGTLGQKQKYPDYFKEIERLRKTKGGIV